MVYDDVEGVVVVVLLGERLQVEGGDNFMRAGQEGQGGEVRSK